MFPTLSLSYLKHLICYLQVLLTLYLIMLILGYSNSEANKNMMSKIWTNGLQLSDCGENNFFFSQYVFKSYLVLMRENEYRWSKELSGTYLKLACRFFFLMKKVTPIIGVFPSANFPQERYSSPSNQFFP